MPEHPPAVETVYVPDGPVSTQVRVAGLPKLGRFQTLAQIGSGSMGSVYRAYDDVLGRPVAIKALHATDLSLRERFLREARAIGAVLHPNILAVFDASYDPPTPYLVMELATGGSLRDRMRDGPLPSRAVREVGIQIARALEAAHEAGIVHRDVKPANILARGEVWKLGDFGIARVPDSTLTVEGTFIGSPSYAAPESLRAARFSPASDVYSLCATLYEALAGVPPHDDHELSSIARKLEEEPRPLPRGAVEDAIMAGLARDPSARPSAGELANRLAIDDGAREVRPRALAAVAIVMALVAAGVVALAVASRGAADEELEPADPVLVHEPIDAGVAADAPVADAAAAKPVERSSKRKKKKRATPAR